MYFFTGLKTIEHLFEREPSHCQDRGPRRCQASQAVLHVHPGRDTLLHLPRDLEALPLQHEERRLVPRLRPLRDVHEQAPICGSLAQGPLPEDPPGELPPDPGLLEGPLRRDRQAPHGQLRGEAHDSGGPQDATGAEVCAPDTGGMRTITVALLG